MTCCEQICSHEKLEISIDSGVKFKKAEATIGRCPASRIHGSSEDETEVKADRRTMRPSCHSCERPLRVCLCAELPPQPIHTATRVLILQHPHETRQKLATVPIVLRCLSNCEVIVGRRLQLGSSQLLDALAPSSSSPLISREDSPAVDESGWRCKSCRRRKLVLLLFPTRSATELKTWMSRLDVEMEHRDRFWQENQGLPYSCNEGKDVEKFVGRPDGEQMAVDGEPVQAGLGFRGVCSDGVSGHFILLVVDGTWQHAREMVKASMPFLSKFVEKVCLPYDITRVGLGMGDSNSIVRKEPFAGCVSTMEAIARTLGMLEPNGIHIEQTLLCVLRQMVCFQATHFAPLKPRPRLQKVRPTS